MRIPRRTTGIAAATLSLLLAAAPAANAEREFTKRFDTVAKGAITYAANTLMTCDAALEGTFCTVARNDRTAPASRPSNSSQLNNNSHQMVQVDVDTDATTANSSSATVSIPAGGSVLWAGLYWTSSAPPGMTATQAKTAKLRGPLDLAYRTVTATDYDTEPSSEYGYSSFLDVTDIVAEQGAGVWTFGGIPILEGKNEAAGWSLVVVYSSPRLPVRDLTVFDGQKIVNGTNLVAIPIDGFRTPAVGAVKSDVGFVAFDGDRGVTGDYLQLNATILRDTLHPATNTFDSWLANYGTAMTGTNPAYGNQLGFDAALMKADGVLPNNSTSADLRAKTNGEGYMPIVLTFSTELYAPNVGATKTVTDLNGGEVRVDDELEYEITTSNIGGDGAAGSAVRENAMPDGTEFVPGSLKYDPGSGYVDLTDASGDDQGDAAGGTGPLEVRVGVGANGSKGGLMAGGLAVPVEYRVKFRVKVVTLPPSGGIISNTATVGYASQTVGSLFESESNSADVLVRLPDATIRKTMSPSSFSNGFPASYSLTVTNRGDAPTEGETVVTDPLPAGLTSPTVKSAIGWNCSITGSDLTCRRSDALAPGASWPVIVVGTDSLSNPAGDLISNTATVSTPLDPDQSNDSSTAQQQVGAGQVALPVDVASDLAEVLPGEQVTFTGSYYNRGPSKALTPRLKLEVTGLTGADVVATGFTVTSSDGSITAADCKLTQSNTAPPTVTCNDKELGNGVSVEIKMKLVPRIGIDASKIDVKASSAASNDPGGPREATGSVDIVPTADLEITKSASSPTVDINGDVTYTLRVENKGPAAATGVRIIDVVPADLSITSAVWALDGGPTGQPCSTTGQTVECNPTGSIVPATGSGAKFAEVTIVAKSDKGGHGPRENRAGVEADQVDLFTSNDTARAEVILLPSADLSISKLGPGSLAPGAKGTFTLVVTNGGPSVASDVRAVDDLPAGLELDPADVLQAGCSAAGRKITCVLADDTTAGHPTGSLSTGETWRITIRARASKTTRPGSKLINRASATSTTPDPNGANAEDSVSVLVARLAARRLATSLKAPRKSTRVGGRIRLKATVTAPKGSAVSNVSLCVSLPSNVRYVSSSGKRSGSRVCWKIRSLAGGSTKSFSLIVKAVRPGRGKAGSAATGSGVSRASASDLVRTHSPPRFTG